MKIGKESIKYSFNNLAHRKARSLLTILSIFIGITTIFIFISFGVGLYNYVEKFSGASSANKLTIEPKGFGGMGFQEAPSFSEEDLRAVEHAGGVYSAEPIDFGAAEITQDKTKKYAFVIAYDPSQPFMMMDVSGIKLLKGRMLQPGDKGKVVLGYNYLVKDKIMPQPYDINSKIIIQGQELRVVGFFEPVGNPQDDSQIYVPQDFFNELYPNRTAGYNWIFAEVDASKMKTVVANVEDALRKSRNLKKGDEDFIVQSFDDLLATYTKVLSGISGFVIMIALISVLISAINTANTMITSVLERIREIGVMKAVGARNSEIFIIFIFESALLGFIAGCLGVFAGWILSSLAGKALAAAGWGFISPYYSVLLFAELIIFATLTGALSGAIPAYRASRTNPVQALRYE